MFSLFESKFSFLIYFSWINILFYHYSSSYVLAMAGNWNQKMAKMAFRKSKFRRLAWGDGDPFPYTPRATFRYQWDDWPLWEKVFHIGQMVTLAEFGIWAFYYKLRNRSDWARDEAFRRMRLRREATELMVLEGETFDSDIMPERRV